MNIIDRDASKLDDLTFNSMFAILQGGMWLLNDIEEYLRPFDMSQGRLSTLLSILDSTDGRIQPAEIALMTGKSRPTVSKMISRLVKDGYVRQLAHELDARGKRLEMTPKGKSLLESIVPGYDGRLRRMAKSLSSQDKREIIKLLAKIDFLDSKKNLG